MSDFQTVFFCLSDKRFLNIIIKICFLKKINLRVRFLPLKIAFFGGFENDKILSSKSYKVTKRDISPALLQFMRLCVGMDFLKILFGGAQFTVNINI